LGCPPETIKSPKIGGFRGLIIITNPIKFGTDGWRAIIAKDFTFDNVRICAQALSEYMKSNNLASRGLVIGYDNRFASEDFAATTAEVAAGNSIKVYLSPKSIPTPEVSYGVLLKKAGAGVVITASHNPAMYNGFKIKSADGTSASTEIIAEIEKNIERIFKTGETNRVPLEKAVKTGIVEYWDIDGLYKKQMTKFVDITKLKKAKLKIIVDSMYGAGTGYFKSLLAGGDIEIIEINSERNPAFPDINPEPIAVNLKKLTETVKREKANLGLATDGDADRIGIVDENGNFITQLEVFALLTLYLMEVRGERGEIIKTVTTSKMIDRLGDMFHVHVSETPVGFKYVAPLMLEKNALIGGEESGGYGFRGHVAERDAVLAGLYFIDFMVSTGKTPAQLLEYLFSKVGQHYYDRRDVKFPVSDRQNIIRRLERIKPCEVAGVKVAKIDAADGFRFALQDDSWLLIRFSGTEPIMRIYAEASTLSQVHKILDAGREMVGM